MLPVANPNESANDIPNATIIHDFISKKIILKPEPTVREEISIEEFAKYIGYDLLNDN